jgi:hypothetical protein
MKLVGVSFAKAFGHEPLQGGYVPLSELSVLLGPNDAGKTQLLELLGEALHRSARPQPQQSEDAADYNVHLLFLGNPIFFLDVAPEELDLFVWVATADLRFRADGGEPPPEWLADEVDALVPLGLSPRERWPLGVWDGAKLDRAAPPNRPSLVDDWANRLASTLDPIPPEWQTILAHPSLTALRSRAGSLEHPRKRLVWRYALGCPLVPATFHGADGPS